MNRFINDPACHLSNRTNPAFVSPYLAKITPGSQMETILMRLLDIEKNSSHVFSLVEGYISGAHTTTQVMTGR